MARPDPAKTAGLQPWPGFFFVVKMMMGLSFKRALNRPLPHAAGSLRRTAVLTGAGVLCLALSTAAWPLDAATAASAAVSNEAQANGAQAASAAAGAHPNSYLVRAGAKLDDIASEITQTSDPATRDRVATELFEANPRAFMGGKRDRLRVGAVLNVPASVYAPGVASAPVSASASTTASFASLSAILAAFNNPASAAGSQAARANALPGSAAKSSAPPMPMVQATVPPALASAVFAASVAASAPATVSNSISNAAPNLAATSGQPSVTGGKAASSAAVASALTAPASAAHVAAPSNPATGVAPVAVAASGTVASTAVAASGASAVAGIAATEGASGVVAASGVSVAASASAVSAPAASAPAASAVADAASGAVAPVSSTPPVTVHPVEKAGFAGLQAWLAFKNRVLMALQAHGMFGSTEVPKPIKPVSAPPVSVAASVPAAAASAAIGGVASGVPAASAASAASATATRPVSDSGMTRAQIMDEIKSRMSNPPTWYAIGGVLIALLLAVLALWPRKKKELSADLEHASDHPPYASFQSSHERAAPVASPASESATSRPPAMDSGWRIEPDFEAEHKPAGKFDAESEHESAAPLSDRPAEKRFDNALEAPADAAHHAAGQTDGAAAHDVVPDVLMPDAVMHAATADAGLDPDAEPAVASNHDESAAHKHEYDTELPQSFAYPAAHTHELPDRIPATTPPEMTFPESAEADTPEHGFADEFADELVNEAASEPLSEPVDDVLDESVNQPGLPADPAAPPDDVENLRAALALTPNDKGLMVRLAALLAQAKQMAAFTDAFYDLRTLSNSEGEEWQKVLELGRDLDPENPLFLSPEERAAARARKRDESLFEPAGHDAAPAAEPPLSTPDPRLKNAMEAIDLSLPSDHEALAPQPVAPAKPAAKPEEEAESAEQSAAIEDTPPPVAPLVPAAETGAHETPQANHGEAPASAPLLDEFFEPAQMETLAPEIIEPALTPIPEPTPEPTPSAESAEVDDEPARPDGLPRMASVAGRSAVKFGVLDLDFDLDLPHQPPHVPVQANELDPVAVSRNKLDLAHEYVALGDVAGARALINEVIDSNDPATREAARALLGSLAPLP